MDYIHDPGVPGCDARGYDDSHGNEFPYKPGRHQRTGTPDDAPGHYAASSYTNAYGVAYASHHESRNTSGYLYPGKTYRAAHRHPDGKHSSGWDWEAYNEDGRPIRRILPARKGVGLHRQRPEEVFADWGTGSVRGFGVDFPGASV